MIFGDLRSIPRARGSANEYRADRGAAHMFAHVRNPEADGSLPVRAVDITR